MNPDGKVALVTGAASGIGRAAAELLAARGASVLAADIDDAGLAETVARIESAGGSASGEVLDVSRADAVAAAFDHPPVFDHPPAIVFNCAGVVSGEPDFPATSPERIGQLIAVNLLGTVLVTRAAILAMNRGGVIVNISSTAAVLTSHPDPVYGATKAAVKTFTEQCAASAHARGVRVNAVLPGAVDTPIIAKTGDGRRPAQWLLPRLREVALLAPAEIASTMLELVENDAQNGACVVVRNA
ncbi:MAG TPA: SDR family NAD(P)-dependent oxidoreductase [Solirubrobacteraceae bacterium]|nr:SDR family NAD(P)-dependent oxidoreductase [Solirubrobacteraceae bacterium]